MIRLTIMGLGSWLLLSGVTAFGWSLARRYGYDWRDDRE